MKSKWLSAALLTFGTLGAVVGIGVVLLVLFVFSMGSASVALQVDTTVLDRATQAPVPNCLLTFDNGSEHPRTPVRSDAQGQGGYYKGYSFMSSIFSILLARERTPELAFYIGDAPLHNTAADAERWHVGLRFEKPWLRKEVVSQIELERRGVREPADKLLHATVRFETESAGGEKNHVLMKVFLDQGQIATCQAPSQSEAERGLAVRGQP